MHRSYSFPASITNTTALCSAPLHMIAVFQPLESGAQRTPLEAAALPTFPAAFELSISDCDFST